LVFDFCMGRSSGRRARQGEGRETKRLNGRKGKSTRRGSVKRLRRQRRDSVLTRITTKGADYCWKLSD